VSPVMARVPFKICVMRLVGTSILRAQFSRAHIECSQFFGQVFTWMDSRKCHNDAPSDNQQSRRSMVPVLGQPTQSRPATDH